MCDCCGRGIGGGGGGYGGIKSDGGRPDSGGEHTTQCADVMLWSCAPETCTVLSGSVVPINFLIKGKKAYLFGLSQSLVIKKLGK